MTEWHVMDDDINGNSQVFHDESDISDISGHHRKVKRVVPDSEKDERYWEKRKRNNIAAKRSRENKRVVEISIRHKMAILEEENNLLKKEISTIKAKFGIPPDSVFLTDEDREKCRVKYFTSDKVSRDGPHCMDSHQARDEESSSPGSSISVCISPRTITKAEFSGNTEGYSREEAIDRSSPDSSLHFHKKKIPLGKRQQRIPGAFPFPQTLFYGSSYGAQLMWASARCPGPVGGMQQIYQEYALNNGTGSSPNNNNNNIVMPQSQFPHYAPTQIPTNTRPQDYFVYRPGAPEHTSEYDEMGEPTDLSAPREKYPEHSQSVKREDSTEVRHTYHQGAHSREEPQQVQGNTPQTTKRRYSQEYSNDNQGHTGIGVQDVRATGTGHQVSEVPHNYSAPTTWPEQRTSVNVGQTETFNSQHRPDYGYYEQGTGYQEQSTRTESPSQQQQPQSVGDNELLRKENEDLKVGLRQLFSQVFKMKDIVLPN